jgi:hypothetical protein
MLFVKTKPASHEQRILQALKKAGHYGAYGHDLAKPSVGGLAWHRRITDLRQEGVNISTVRINRSTFKYFYDGDIK